MWREEGREGWEGRGKERTKRNETKLTNDASSFSLLLNSQELPEMQESSNGQQISQSLSPTSSPPHPSQTVLIQERSLLGQGRDARRFVPPLLSPFSSFVLLALADSMCFRFIYSEFPVRSLDLTKYLPPPLPSSGPDSFASSTKQREDPRDQTGPFVYELCESFVSLFSTDLEGELTLFDYGVMQTPSRITLEV